MNEEPTIAPDLKQLAATAKEVVVQATERRLRLATVESCTGGLVAHLLTEVPGASQVLETGWVCYSNEAKIRLLGVSKQVLLEHGAVSEQVAQALSVGGLTRIGADLVVSTTGIAGPTGATPGKPVGLMWCALSNEHETTSLRVLRPGLDRSATKRAFAGAALQHMLERLGTL